MSNENSARRREVESASVCQTTGFTYNRNVAFSAPLGKHPASESHDEDQAKAGDHERGCMKRVLDGMKEDLQYAREQDKKAW